MKTLDLIDKIESMGVEFAPGYKPTRAHQRKQGGERMTLLCCEIVHGRKNIQYDANMKARWLNRTINRIELCETTKPIEGGIELEYDFGDLQVWFNR